MKHFKFKQRIKYLKFGIVRKILEILIPVVYILMNYEHKLRLGNRRLGITTRQVDNAVQHLFRYGWVKVADHVNSDISTIKLVNTLYQRLRVEHDITNLKCINDPDEGYPVMKIYFDHKPYLHNDDWTLEYCAEFIEECKTKK